MKGDFSKFTYEPLANYTGVLHQQGRVLLDQDWNSADRIGSYLHQTLAKDSISNGVVAIPAAARDSFLVTKAEVAADGSKVDVTFQSGRGWLGGLHLHIPPTSPLTVQADYYPPPLQSHVTTPASIDAGTVDAVVLEVWEDSFNAFQDPVQLLEPGLGGPDTTERVKLQYALRLLRMNANSTCGDVTARLTSQLDKGALKATLQPAKTLSGDCPVQLGGGYTGFEHYYYRIEVANPGNDGKARFKWSRFNGGLVGRGRLNSAGDTITVTANDQMINHCGLNEFYLEALKLHADGGRWVVVFSAKATLTQNGELKLSDIANDSPGRATWPAADDGTAFFRLWDGVKTIESFTGAVVEDQQHLELGIILEFEAPTENNANYWAGDYWAFEVRAAGVDWQPPTALIDGPPQGIAYFRASLALLKWDKAPGTAIRFEQGLIHDCRKVFQPLTDLNSCCTFTVGDGVKSNGHFNSLEQALQHLPSDGGQICLLPGIHKANVRLIERKNIRITGCGTQTIVHPHPEKAGAAIFSLSSCDHIRLENMNLVSLSGTAIEVIDSQDTTTASKRIYIQQNAIAACIHAIDVRVRNELAGGNDIRIINNEIAMFDKEEGEVAIFTWADLVLIENNRILVIPVPAANDSADPRKPDDPNNPVDPCQDSKKFYTDSYVLQTMFIGIFAYLHTYQRYKAITFKARGGIQIGGGSEQVRVKNNRIVGGNGNGITLGHLPTEGDLGKAVQKMTYVRGLSAQYKEQLSDKLLGTLYDITIEDNAIHYMGLSGIGLAAFFSRVELGLMINIENLVIYRNTIQYCAQQTPEEKPESMLRESGFGGIVLDGCEDAIIRENIIEHNGPNQLEPVCGVLILYGEKIDISDNRIINNGPRKLNDDSGAKRGLRGGILVIMSFARLLEYSRGDDSVLVPDGIPAVKVHDNVVTQPYGQALFLMAFGPVSVVGNHFTTQGADYRVNSFSLLAGAVMIFNLGISKDLMAMMLLASFRYLPMTNAAAMTNRSIESREFYDYAKRYLYLPNGNVMFSNNQTSLDLRGKELNFSFSSQLIVSLDDVSYSANQSEITSYFDFVFTDVAIMAVTIRTNDNRFQEGFTNVLNSLFSFGFMNMATANQATHCIKAFGATGYRLDSPNTILFNFQCSSEYAKMAESLHVKL